MRTIWYVLLVIIVIGAVGWFLSMRSSKSNHTNSVPTAERAIGLPAPDPEGTEAPPGPSAGTPGYSPEARPGKPAGTVGSR
jgi:hypothetical protein